MGRLQTKATKCDYKEDDRELREQFIHWLHDEGMMSEILGGIRTGGH